MADIFAPQRLAATLLNTAGPIDVKFPYRQNDTTIAMQAS
ncbi:hypothetical protein M673_18520 (plasmid) [Aureimonas sp. AU20]|nr:hypothetical protein M673_18520 [Aureimonas sp. AU20]